MNLIYHCPLCQKEILVNPYMGNGIEASPLVQCPECEYYFIRSNKVADETVIDCDYHGTNDYENICKALKQFEEDGLDCEDDEVRILELYIKAYDRHFRLLDKEDIPVRDMVRYEVYVNKLSFIHNTIANRLKAKLKSVTDCKEMEVSDFPISVQIKMCEHKHSLWARIRDWLKGKIKTSRSTQIPSCKNIVFLDFDGVMNNFYYSYQMRKQGKDERDQYGTVFDTDSIAALKHIVEATGARIVISSSWKEFMSYKEILHMWEDRNLPGSVIDSTPTCSRHRGDEIDAWLDEYRYPCRYVILDDLEEDNFNQHQLNNFIQVDPYRGLTMEHAEKAIEILKSNTL